MWGLPCPPHCCGSGALLPHLFTLTRTSRARRYIFCGTFRRTGLNPASRTLSGTLLCGVRTFLPAHSRKSNIALVLLPEWAGRPSGPAAHKFIIFDAAAGQRTQQEPCGADTPVRVLSSRCGAGALACVNGAQSEVSAQRTPRTTPAFHSERREEFEIPEFSLRPKRDKLATQGTPTPWLSLKSLQTRIMSFTRNLKVLQNNESTGVAGNLSQNKAVAGSWLPATSS